MKLNRLAISAGLGIAVVAAAGCSGAPGDDQGSSEGEGAVNTDAPIYDQLPDAIKEKGAITIAADTHPPYRTIEEDGTITGLDPDLQVALSEQLGVPFEPEMTSGLDAMLTGMLSGRFDAFNGPVRTTEEREQDFDTIVWMTTRSSYLYLLERADELSDPAAMCGARVAGVSGSVTERQVDLYAEWCAGEGLDAPEFVGLADSNATFLAVNSDRADYAGTTSLGALDLIAAEPDTYDYFSQTDEQGAGEDQLAIFLPKGNGLAEPMFAAFEEIFANGEYDAIMSDWGISDVAVDEPVLNLITGK